MVTDTAVSESERRQALQAVLSSQTFSRSTQLRAFLGYICEREISGHVDELTEYHIAIKVLGRGQDYNLSDDSAVRNRAYELRQRLEKFYRQEQPNAEIRIEVPRGSYVPSYTRRVPLESGPVPAAVKTVPLGPPPQNQLRRTWMIAGLLAATLASGFGLGVLVRSPSHASELQEAWGPLARPDQDLLISVATNLHMIVRPHIAPERLRFPAPPELHSIYGATRPLPPDSVLFMQPAQISVPFGEMIATTTLCTVRSLFGGSYQILPEAEAPITALRGRNSILIGSGTNSLAANVLLADLPWSIDYGEGDQIALIDHRKSRSNETTRLANASRNPEPGIQYSLLTVIRAHAVDGKLIQTVVISGVGSAGIQSAVEFFCSSERLGELKTRFERDGKKGFPPVYQVVIRCRTAGVRLVSSEYAGHVVVSDRLQQ